MLPISANMKHFHFHFVFPSEPYRLQVHDTLATCGWHASHCVSIVHGDEPVAISTANEEALCNECLAQVPRWGVRCYYSMAFSWIISNLSSPVLNNDEGTRSVNVQ